MIGYWIVQFVYIRKMLAAKGGEIVQKNPTKIRWIKWFTASELLIILPPLILLIIGSFDLATTLLQVCGLLAAVIQSYFLFSHPGILYGLKGIVINESAPAHVPTSHITVGEKEEVSDGEQTKRKPTVQYLNESMLDRIQLDIDKYMQQKRPYLQPGFGLTDMTRGTSFTTHQVSGFINKRYQMNFYSFVNQYRIEYCKKKFESKEYLNKTIEAIANESGFQSRATFIRAFKISTGLTPSEYIKTLKSKP